MRRASVYADAILIFATAAFMNYALSLLQGVLGRRGRKQTAAQAADKAALAATSGA